MIIRVISLSLALLIGISAIIPLTTNYTEANEKKPKNQKKIGKRYKIYSKQWWRAYHNYVRQKRAKIARKRILRLRRIRIAKNRYATAQPTGQKATNTAPNTQVSNLFILVEGKVKKVFDGKTFNVETKDGKVYLIRMLGIDTPQMNQDFGDRSQKKLSDLILEKDATVIIRKRDSSGLYIGTVYCGGEDINLTQVKTGMAWYFQPSGYEVMSGDRNNYEQAQQTAKTKRMGLWGRQKFINSLAFKN